MTYHVEVKSLAGQPCAAARLIYGHWTDAMSQLRTDVFYLLEASRQV